MVALLCTILGHTCLAAEGLSFTTRNKDELCGGLPYCSDVQLRQSEKGGRTEANFNIRQFSLRALITLYPNGGQNENVTDVKSVEVDVEIQTRGQLKYELMRRNVPIRVQGKGATAVRYCEVEFNPNFEILAVRGIDAREKDRKGNVLFRHMFR